MRTAITILVLTAACVAPISASARMSGGAMSGGAMPSGVHAAGGMPGPAASGPTKVVHAPVPMTRRMTLNLGCYQRRYNQLRAAGQDAGLASAGAALICG